MPVSRDHVDVIIHAPTDSTEIAVGVDFHAAYAAEVGQRRLRLICEER